MTDLAKEEKPQEEIEEEKEFEKHDSDDEQEDSTTKKKGLKDSGSRAGVIYLSRVPTKMNVKIIRDYFSSFGEVNRIYLEPKEKKRKNEPRSFAEGWVEFKKKRVAKQVAKKLNNNQVGGTRRHNPWYNELWNIKYLKDFKWTHLNERKAYEQEVRKQRLRQEIALAKKETAFYVQNVEKFEKKKRLDKKNKDGEGNQEESAATTSLSLKQKTADNDDQDSFSSKRPKFERKIKVTDNDLFLKQIFSQ